MMNCNRKLKLKCKIWIHIIMNCNRKFKLKCKIWIHIMMNCNTKFKLKGKIWIHITMNCNRKFKLKGKIWIHKMMNCNRKFKLKCKIWTSVHETEIIIASFIPSSYVSITMCIKSCNMPCHSYRRLQETMALNMLVPEQNCLTLCWIDFQIQILEQKSLYFDLNYMRCFPEAPTD